MTRAQYILSLDQIAEAAGRLYDEQFRGQYEGSHDGEFLAIDVMGKKAFLGRYPEDALGEARRAVPDGAFYLVRIGEPATFNVGYPAKQQSNLDRTIRPPAPSAPGLQPA